MKKTTHLLYAILAASIYTSSAHASCTDGTGCLQVPGDFSNPVNNFSMYLLGGQFNIELQNSVDNNIWIGIGGSASQLNTIGKQLNFTATQFDHIGPGQGTSILSANFNHYVIGSGDFLGNLATIYVDGLAAGTLVDNMTSTQGQWTLNTHLFADWGGVYGIDFGVIPLSTNASYSYNLWNDIENHDATATGSSMDYHTGLASFVGQGIFHTGDFGGAFRVTFMLNGQDPLAAPVPTAAWLLGSGLIGLAGFARQRKIA